VCGNNWAWGSYTNATPGNNGATDGNGLDNGNGIFYRTDGLYPPWGTNGRRLKLEMITNADGTSKTFMVGEDIPVMSRWCSWPYFNNATGTCCIPLNSATQPGQPAYNNPGDWPNTYSFRSRHNSFGGANFAMADTSVVFINNNIDLNVYRGLASWNGKETVNLP